MNKLYFSKEQNEICGHNFVFVNNEWIPYTEWFRDEHVNIPSNFDDAILVYEGEEYPEIRCLPNDNSFLFDIDVEQE